MSKKFRLSKKVVLAEDSGDEEEEEDNLKVIDNHIYFYNDVTVKTMTDLTIEIKKLTKKLLAFNIAYDTDVEIFLHINSGGGDVFGVLSIINLIINNKVNIVTVIEGQACSAATILSMIGSRRQITENSYMLIHNLSSGFWGKMHEMEDEMKNLTLLTKDIKKMYKTYTKITTTQLESLLKKDLLLDAKTCLRYGLVDEIV